MKLINVAKLVLSGFILSPISIFASAKEDAKKSSVGPALTVSSCRVSAAIGLLGGGISTQLGRASSQRQDNKHKHANAVASVVMDDSLWLLYQSYSFDPRSINMTGAGAACRYLHPIGKITFTEKDGADPEEIVTEVEREDGGPWILRWDIKSGNARPNHCGFERDFFEPTPHNVRVMTSNSKWLAKAVHNLKWPGPFKVNLYINRKIWESMSADEKSKAPKLNDAKS